MFLQDLNNAPMMPLELQLASRLSPIVLRRNLDERMNSNGWLFQPQPPILSGVSAELLNQNLWQRFYEHKTEMIITKTGRRMFPSVQINVSNLKKRETYYVLLEIAPASNQRHKYCGYENGNRNGNMGGWNTAGPADPQHSFDRRVYIHPDSPATGDHWMDNSINFNKLKLTNNVNDKDNVILTSMHKYIPKIWIIQCSTATNLNQLFSNPATSFVFKEMEFIAVTAYQNDNITKLKINHNPFAKGFRETGQSRFKRKYYQIDQEEPRPGSSRADNEESSVSFTDSESNHVSSERSSVVSNVENLMQETPPKRLAIENNMDNDARDDARPIAASSPVPIIANPRLAENVENNHEVFLHRPWLDLPRRQEIPSLHYNRPLLTPYGNMYTNNIANYIRFHTYHHQFSSYYPWSITTPWSNDYSMRL